MFDSVRLLYAQPFNYAVSGMTWDQTNIHVHVKNRGLGSSRMVLIRHTSLNEDEWTDNSNDPQLTFVKDFGTHSLYEIDLPGNRQEFALRYKFTEGLNNLEKWDNNEGWNYRVASFFAPPGAKMGTVGGRVGLVKAKNVNTVISTKFGIPYIKEYKISAEIAVENTGYIKQVGLFMSWDSGYNVWSNVNASFAYSFITGGSTNVEIWKIDDFKIITHPLSNPIRFAVFYFDISNGQQYWDNNFMQDYFLDEPTESEVM